MAWICTRAEQLIQLEQLLWADLQAIELQALGLVQDPESHWCYISKPFGLLGYSIQPLLLFNVERNPTEINLSLQRVKVHGLSGLEQWLNVKGGIRIVPAAPGAAVHHWLELGIERKGALALLPQATLRKAMQQAAEQTGQRFGRRLMTRLLEGVELKNDQNLP
jgi:hypothetical protein